MISKLLIIAFLLFPLKAMSNEFTLTEIDGETFVCYDLQSNASLLSDLKLNKGTLELLERKHLKESESQAKMYDLLLAEKDKLYLKQKANTDDRIALYKAAADKAYSPGWVKYVYIAGGALAASLLIRVSN